MKRQKNIAIAFVSLMSVSGLLLGPAAFAHPQELNPASLLTGDLHTARSLHTATLLPDGRVLVVGGIGGTGIIPPADSAELYDPDEHIWSVTSPLNKKRHGHTATLLPSGKVLVTGGYISGSKTTNTAEVFDPATGTWALTGSLDTRRASHTATLLTNGKVLVTGGWDGSSAIAGAELYDPETENWSNTGNLNAPRCMHTATLLQSGKVLVAGGTDVGDLDFVTLAIVELYDPGTATWSGTASLSEPRVLHTATLLQNGKVLVVGGYGGYSHTVSDSELYDPVAGEWTHTGNLNTIRTGHSSTMLPKGRILVAGGGNSGILDSADLYDPATGVWGRSEGLRTPRYAHTATLLENGKVLLAGGRNSGGSLSSAELYDASGAITITIPKIVGATVAGKKLFVTGENFEPGAVILLNGEQQKTRSDEGNPTTSLIGKRAGKKVRPGDKLQVKNPNGLLSDEFIYTAGS